MEPSLEITFTELDVQLVVPERSAEVYSSFSLRKLDSSNISKKPEFQWSSSNSLQNTSITSNPN